MYRGETMRYTFEGFVTKLQNAYMTLAEYGEPVAETKKVNDLIEKIKVTNPALLAGISTIVSRADLCEDFAASSSYLAKIVGKQKSALSRRNIKVVEIVKTPGGGKDKGKGKGKIKIQARSYSKEEWVKLTPEQRKKVASLRDAKKKRRAAAAARAQDEESDEDDSAGLAMNRSKKQRVE